MSDSILSGSTRRLFAATLALLVWIGLLTLFPGQGIGQTPEQQYCPDIESPRAMEPILENPEEYLGCKIVVEGTLEKEEGSEKATYSIDMGQERSIQIWPWAPEESELPKSPAQEPSNLQTMSSLVGHRFRILGHIVQGRGGRIVIEASIIQQLDEGQQGAD